MELHTYGCPEDLPASLRGHVRSLPGSSFVTFHHPFLVDIFPIGLPADIETVLRIREEHARQKLYEGEVSSYIFGHQRPYRMRELLRLVRAGRFEGDARSAVRFWRLAASVWSDAEEDEASLVWGMLLASPVPLRGAMTTRAARRALQAMPDELTLYRGLHAVDPEEARDAACVGYSWSLSLDTSEFFARRHLPLECSAWVATTTISRGQVIAYLTQRGEEEILIDSDALSREAVLVSKLDAGPRGEPELVSLQEFLAE